MSRAQGLVTIVQTGQGEPVVSASFPLTGPDGLASFISFSVGFSTDEEFGPDVFFDAATAALSNPDSSLFLPLVTMDASGALWAPGGEGTIPFPVWAIDRELIAPPEGAPVLAQNMAWHVSLVLPDAFLESDVLLFLDLFDNNDEVPSAAWIFDVKVEPVPEPGFGALAVAGLFAFFFGQRRAR